MQSGGLHAKAVFTEVEGGKQLSETGGEAQEYGGEWWQPWGLLREATLGQNPAVFVGNPCVGSGVHL